MNIILAIFAAPIMHVIGFFLVICIVAWALWWLLTTVLFPAPAPNPMRRNLGYIVYVVVVAIMFIWWIDFAFGLGLF